MKWRHLFVVYTCSYNLVRFITLTRFVVTAAKIYYRVVPPKWNDYRYVDPADQFWTLRLRWLDWPSPHPMWIFDTKCFAFIVVCYRSYDPFHRLFIAKHDNETGDLYFISCVWRDSKCHPKINSLVNLLITWMYLRSTFKSPTFRPSRRATGCRSRVTRFLVEMCSVSVGAWFELHRWRHHYHQEIARFYIWPYRLRSELFVIQCATRKELYFVVHSRKGLTAHLMKMSSLTH